MTFPAERRRAVVVGTGLIGGSLGLALRRRGWYVTGRDRQPDHAARALERGALDAVGDDPGAELTVVATPVGAVASEAAAALKDGGVVTDVAGVKAPVVAAVGHARFVGGHPMAGSEQEGIDGADPELFSGAAWVLTPVAGTDPAAHARVRSVVKSLGAEVVEVAPERHDAMVAVVSHVPHLVAAVMMGLAGQGFDEQAALMRLAAGGFRDMTRVAAGHPGIWPDICAENRTAIASELEHLETALAAARIQVEKGDRSALLDTLERARAARARLPVPVADGAELVEVRVPVPDRPGVLAEITTLATAVGVNIVDLEIAHSGEGRTGVVILVIGAQGLERLRGGLVGRGYRPSAQGLE